MKLDSLTLAAFLSANGLILIYNGRNESSISIEIRAKTLREAEKTPITRHSLSITGRHYSRNSCLILHLNEISAPRFAPGIMSETYR